jgi:TolB-like protein/tetratricopeptide (TPR) repeat protein
MVRPAEPLPSFRFATFELDVRSRELRSGTRRIRLQEQPFEILSMMLERPGDVVTRDELQRRLWPDGTFVDFEHALNAAVKRLRSALGDDADHPQFVETVPRRGYRFIAKLDRPLIHDTGPIAAALEAQPRLVVLPLTNLSDDSSQEYFSDGLTEELIAQLGVVCRGRIGIIARWSAMAYKGTSQRAREIGEALHVKYLLEGSVRHEGDRVRIVARLIEAETETQIWSESYERDLSDGCHMASGRLSVQTDVASRVARALALELAPPSPAITHSQSLAPSTYESYLKGRYHWNVGGEEGLNQALAAFSRVVTEAPAFSAGHAALARARIASAESYRGVPRDELMLAHAAAVRALAIDADVSEAHLALGDIRRLLEWDWRGAEQAYVRALVLNPSLESAHRSYSAMLVVLQRGEDAVREVERACGLDPLCLISTLSAAWIHYLVGDSAEAVARCRRTIDMDPERVSAHRLLGAALLALDRPADARTALDRALALAPDDPATIAWLAHARAVAGDASGAASELERLRASGQYVPPYHLAVALVGLGDMDAAFRALERGCAERDPMTGYVTVDPRFEALRRDPRYSTMRDALGLERDTLSA